MLPARAARAAALAPVPLPASAAPSRPPGAYLPALDGLRAVAVLAVVAYHLGELSGGFLGVDVFFAISGFLITRLLLAEHEGSGAIGLRSFWARRFRRLLPALLVVIVAVMVGSRAWLPTWRLGDIRTDALAAIAYVANWRFVLSGQSYFQSGVVPSPVRHTWSLSIEEQYYLLWPLVVVGLARWRQVPLRRLVALASLAGALASGAWMAIAAGQGRDLSRI
ncbi:MAG: acyltransferase [Acidimicrobiales bacterium]